MKSAFAVAVLLAVSLVNAAFAQSSPTIVAKVQLLDQSAAIAPTTIYTPTATGMYRISTVMVLTQANGTTESNSYYWGWVASTYARTPGTAPATDLLYVTKLSTASGVAAMMCSAGQPISFSTITSGDTSNAKFSVYIEIEKL